MCFTLSSAKLNSMVVSVSLTFMSLSINSVMISPVRYMSDFCFTFSAVEESSDTANDNSFTFANVSTIAMVA